MQTLVIDIRPLLPKRLPGGVPEYTRQLLLAMFPLLAEKQGIRVVLFSSGSQTPNLEMFGAWQNMFSHYHLRLPNKALNISFKLLGWPCIDTLIKNAYRLPANEPITVFAPNINLLPVSRQAKLVVTFHDLSFERYPFFLKRKDALWHTMVNPRRFARRASRIIAVSESTRQDLVSIYQTKPERIAVIYSGIDKEFKPKMHAPGQTRYAILYLGSSEGRKNVDALIKAYAQLKQRLSDAKLLLVGPPHRSVSGDERLTLYQSASLFVYPSFFEGFGLPPVEAMACGIPVITSYSSSLPEAVGQAALTTNPHRAPELAHAMHSLLTDQTLRNHYIEQGLMQANKFTWENAAEKTIDILLKTKNFS